VRVPALNLLERAADVPFPLFSPALAAALRRELARTDVVHAHGFLYLSSVGALVGASATRPSRRPARVLTEHVGHVPYASAAIDRVEGVAIASVGRLAARSADAVIVFNGRVDDEIAALAPNTPRSFIPNGIDLERYRPPAPGERAALRARLGWDDRPRILFVGRLVERKGLELVVAVGTAAAGALEVLLVGPGDPPRDLPPSVHAVGPRDADAVAELYRAADALLLPSHGEGFPVVAQEALASGLPVVLRDLREYAATIEGAGEAVQLAAPEPAALRRALDAVLADPDARERARRAARAHAEARFSWERAVEAHERVYAEAVERVRARPRRRRPSAARRS
jgi:glycosyltransferase involved in cell wall biosynthesis